MKKLISSKRLIGSGIVLALLLILYGCVLFKLQIVDGASYNKESANSIVTNETVAASRGNILDRYGRLLVSSKTCYNIIINTDELFEQDDPNSVILEMIDIVESEGETYTDSLPITMQSPFAFTKMSDIQRTVLDGYVENAKKNYSDLAHATGLDDGDPTAVELMAFFRSRYKIDNAYDNEQMRKIAGLRYELNSRYIIDTSDYIFVEDASLGLITKLLEANIPGIEVSNSYVREYNTSGAAHLLGYLGLMNQEEYESKYQSKNYSYNAKVGKEGAELAFEDYLHGSDGTAAVTKNSDGATVKRVYTTEPQPGNNVYLSLDIVLQEAVERILASNIESFQAQRDLDNEHYRSVGETDLIKEDISGGAIAVVNVKTNEPLALASWPTYDLSTLLENYNEVRDADNQPLLNRALMGQYEPGSTFKPVTAIAALSEGVITPESTITDEGVFRKYEDAGYAPACWVYNSMKTTHGTINVAQALMVSCNYFFYSVGDTLGITKLSNYAKAFGLGEHTGIELPESTGSLATPEYKEQLTGGTWYAGDTVQASIGQSYNLFTPLQLASYIATVANGGQRHSASILKKVSSYDYSETIYSRQPELLNTVKSDERNYKAVQYGMYLVANSANGTAYSTFYDYPVAVAAKTGSAQRGEGSTANACFVCYAPYDDPQVAVAVVVEKGAAGSSIAVLAREVLDAYFSIQSSNESVDSEMTLLQ